MNPKVFAHTTYIGPTGYNNHSRDFFRHLSKYCKVKVNNFTIGNSWKDLSDEPHNNEDYITDIDKELLSNQWLWSGNKRNTHPIYSKHGDDFESNVDIVLAGSNHHLFHDTYNNPTIAYNVWESTVQEERFFNKLLKFDQIWVPSEWQAACTIKQGASVDQVKVVPEGVDIKTFKPINKIKKDKFQFLIIGRWEYRKYTTEMIQSFNKVFKDINGVELVLVVDNKFATDGFESTEERLKHHNINTDRIKVLSFLSRKEYVELIQNTDVFLSCSRSEGWNLPLIEALSCGVPSIYSNCSGQLQFAEGKGLPINIIGEVKDDLGIGNYYEPDIHHLQDQILEVFKNYPRYLKKAVEDSKKIHQDFDWNTIAKNGFETLKQFITMNDKKMIFECPPGQEELTKNFQREIFEENEYDRFGVGIDKGDVVLDCGANVGIFTQYALSKGASKVYAYECDEPFYKCYNNNIVDERAHCTLGYVGHDKYDLPKIFKQHNLDRVNFIKLDIEHHEWEMFKHMKKEDMRRIDKWVIEFHTSQYNQNVSEEDKKIRLGWLLEILEQFSVNGFKIKYEQIHKGWDVAHLYAEIE